MLKLLPSYHIRYSDRYSERWIRLRGPEEWRGRTTMRFREVPFMRLEPAGSLTHIEVRAYWRQALASGDPMPPLVVSGTPHGTFYVHDGNHRYVALAEYFADRPEELARVRVALIEPMPGYEFVWRWFDGYGCYSLQSAEMNAGATGRQPLATPALA